jgi:glycosyltransferase involved in cell wall biosynthesis
VRPRSGVLRARDLPDSSRLVLDIAAGRLSSTPRPLTEDELGLCSRHGLMGLLALSDHPVWAQEALPAFTRLAARQQAMERVLRGVLERLAEAAIPVTVVKGPALAAWAYREPRHRTYTDLDVVVPADRIDRTLEVLANDDHTVVIPPKTPKADKRNVSMADESGVRFTLDLHWDLFSYSQLRGCAAAAAREGWRDAAWDEDHPLGPMWRLPQPMLMAFLATHAVLDHRFRLILFRDLAEVAASGQVDWSGLVAFAARHDLRSTTYTAWSQARQWVGASIPNDVLAQLRPRSVPVRAVDLVGRRIDPVTFDGHRPHPLNLAIVLLHDRRPARLKLVAAAPFAFPEWSRRVESPGALPRGKRPVGREAPAVQNLVLHVLPADLARGAQTYARALRDSLDGAIGVHRSVTLFESEPASLEADIELDVPTGLGRRVGLEPRALRRLRRLLRSEPPAVVVAHGGEALKYAAFCVKRPTRLVYYKIGVSGDLLTDPLRRSLYRALVRRADLVAGVSQEVLLEARKLGRLPDERTTQIPNGRYVGEFAVDHIGGESPTPRLLFVGHLTRTKRPDWFIEAIRALRERGVETTGWMVGDGPLSERLARHLDPQIEMLGRRTDVPQLYARADIFLFPSMVESEGMPGVLIEAGLAGLPAVTTDVPGAHDVIEHGVTGYIVRPDDFDGFVDAAEELARSIDLRQRMGAEARDRCLDRFTMEQSLERWRHVLSEQIAAAR